MIEGHRSRPPHEIAGHKPHEPHGPGKIGPRPEGPREMEMRAIAEDLVNALESEDRVSKVEAVFGVLNRFELKKLHHPRPPHEHPESPVPHDPRPPAPPRP